METEHAFDLCVVLSVYVGFVIIMLGRKGLCFVFGVVAMYLSQNNAEEVTISRYTIILLPKILKYLCSRLG